MLRETLRNWSRRDTVQERVRDSTKNGKDSSPNDAADEIGDDQSEILLERGNDSSEERMEEEKYNSSCDSEDQSEDNDGEIEQEDAM